jgi:hypothetical protein
VGKGYKIAIESLNEGRIGIAAQMVHQFISIFPRLLLNFQMLLQAQHCPRDHT